MCNKIILRDFSAAYHLESFNLLICFWHYVDGMDELMEITSHIVEQSLEPNVR